MTTSEDKFIATGSQRHIFGLWLANLNQFCLSLLFFAKVPCLSRLWLIRNKYLLPDYPIIDIWKNRIQNGRRICQKACVVVPNQSSECWTLFLSSVFFCSSKLSLLLVMWVKTLYTCIIQTASTLRRNWTNFWKRCFISMVRPSVHTNPSRKRSFKKRSSNRRNLKTPALHFRADNAFWEPHSHHNQVIFLTELSSNTNLK